MSINIKATNTTLTDALKQDILDKISVLDDFLKPEDKIYLEVEVEPRHQSGDIYKVDINIQPHGHYAKAEASDMYAAIDKVMPKIREQLAKKKDKDVSLRRKLGSFYKRFFSRNP